MIIISGPFGGQEKRTKNAQGLNVVFLGVPKKKGDVPKSKARFRAGVTGEKSMVGGGNSITPGDCVRGGGDRVEGKGPSHRPRHGSCNDKGKRPKKKKILRRYAFNLFRV